MTLHVVGEPQLDGLDALIDQHRRWLAYLGRADSTIEQRDRHVRRLQAEGVDPVAATADDLEQWAIGMTGRMADESRATATSHIRGWFGWLVEAGHLDDNPAARLRRPRVRPGVPRPTPLVEVRRAIMASPLRERAMMTLAAGAGLRSAEIAGLRWRDVQRDPMPVLTVRGKGNKVRTVPASVSVIAVLDEMRRTQTDRPVWVFPRRDGRPGPLKPHNVSQSGARAMRDVGVDSTMHQLRHTFATQLYAETQDIRLVQQLLGHATIVTTQRYVGLAEHAAAAGVDAVDVALRQAS